MTSKRTNALSILVGPMILPVAGGDAWAKDRVTRPFKGRGNVTMVINLRDGSLQSQGWGQATHIGRFTNRGSGVIDLSTGDGWATGLLTAANGDQISWCAQLTRWSNRDHHDRRDGPVCGRQRRVHSRDRSDNRQRRPGNHDHDHDIHLHGQGDHHVLSCGGDRLVLSGEFRRGDSSPRQASCPGRPPGPASSS